MSRSISSLISDYFCQLLNKLVQIAWENFDWKQTFVLPPRWKKWQSLELSDSELFPGHKFYYRNQSVIFMDALWIFFMLQLERKEGKLFI